MASFGLSNENYWSVEKQYRNRLNGHFVSLLQMLPREENGLANEKKVSKVEVLDLAKKHIEELERKKRELEEDNVGLEETVTELKKRWVNLGSFRA
jgi:predicted nuclease with TOPRIM domain